MCHFTENPGTILGNLKPQEYNLPTRLGNASLAVGQVPAERKSVSDIAVSLLQGKAPDRPKVGAVNQHFTGYLPKYAHPA